MLDGGNFNSSMRMMDPTFLPAWRLAELIRGGAIGCLELLDHFIARVERLDGKTNAVVVRDFDRARDACPRARPAAQGWPCRTAVRRADDGEGKLQRRRPADHLGLRGAAQQRRARGRAGRAAAAARPARWCSARPTCRSASPTGRASIRSTARPTIRGTSRIRRAVRRAAARRRWRRGLTGAGDRQRHRRLDPRAGALLRRVRPQADLGAVLRRAASRWRPLAAMTDISVIGPLARSADGSVAGAGRDRRPGPAAETALRVDTAAAARDAPVGAAHRRLVERAGPGDRCRDHGAYRRAGGVPGTARAPRSAAPRGPSSIATEAFHLYLGAAQRGAERRASEEVLARMRDAKARRPADDMSADAIIGARGRYDASRLAAPERAALPDSPRLGRVLPRLGRAAVPGDRHRRRCRTCSRARPGNAR